MFKVSSFKSNAQNDEHETKKSGSKFSKSQVQLSSSPDEREDLISKSHDSQKHSLSYPTQGEGDTKMGSIAIQKLFKKWLIMLRTQTSSITINGNVDEKTVQSTTTSETEHVKMSTRAGRMLKAALVYFSGLDAAITIPLLVL